MIRISCILLFFVYILDVEALELTTQLPQEVEKILNGTRRIINGEEVTNDRPYMVYLKLPRSNKKQPNYRTWLCSGVIIHEEYIMTSAACIEDAEHFYVVSGTYKYSDDDDRYNNPCIKNGAKKAIWKCIPKNYVFDGHENDNIRWMNNDIAVVKVEEGFDFTRLIKGCDFIPKPISHNNQSQILENPGSVVSVAGWGTTSKYNDWVNRRKENQQNLLEAHVEIISKNKCKRRWGSRYHNIIDNYMICTKDVGQTMSEICNNDHGGPLVYGTGVNSIVIGVISACLVKERTNKCYGPFLFTSVYKNRQFISCVIYKDVEPKCRRQFRSGVTHVEKVISWKNHDDGPAKNELEMVKKPETDPEIVHGADEPVDAIDDKVFPGSGFILRATNDTKVPLALNETAKTV
ncbi:granzyme M-like isoform X2 [Galleria mellonella]|uniref:Granzyme M-like isoform X2 n=1 Tax=Galleria mellonella TaxID=7137 RepID=A0A6J3BVX7_GALME|nr:granzyme M-like isoform X2 [Galleria mellonella]